MKLLVLFVAPLVGLATVAWAASPGVEQQVDGITVARPSDTGAALVNPGMGWTMHYYSNVPDNYGSHLAAGDTAERFPGVSTVYLRVPWSMV